MEWYRREISRCSGCGTVPDDWLDDRGRPKDDDDPTLPWKATRIYCHGCAQIEANDDPERKKKRRPGTLFGFRRKRSYEV